MTQLQQYLTMILDAKVNKMIISNPSAKSNPVKKIIIEKKTGNYQIASYTEKQVFHENLTADTLLEKCVELIENNYRQVNGMSENEEHIILISKKGQCNYKVKKNATDAIKSKPVAEGHNRKKNYILSEGMDIEPLVDMGVFSKDGKVINYSPCLSLKDGSLNSSSNLIPRKCYAIGLIFTLKNKLKKKNKQFLEIIINLN